MFTLEYIENGRICIRSAENYVISQMYNWQIPIEFLVPNVYTLYFPYSYYTRCVSLNSQVQSKKDAFHKQ